MFVDIYYSNHTNFMENRQFKAKTCIKCGKEFESKRKDAQFCSDKCQKALSRTNVTDNPKDVGDNVGDKSALLRHIESTSVEDLEEEGTWIPNWKREGKTKAEAQAHLMSLLSQLGGWFEYQGYKIKI